MNLVRYAEANWEVGSEKSGSRVKYLNDLGKGEAEGFEMTVRRYDKPEMIPRHRHNVDQIRFTLQGPDSAWSLEQATPPGSFLFVCASTFYGPYDRAGGVEYWTVKFGGWEDRKTPFPKPRFTIPIEFNPENFEWSSPVLGVRHKELASFTERRSRVEMIEVEPNCSYDLLADRTTLAFVTRGTGTIDHEPLNERDGITVNVNEQVRIEAVSTLTLIVLTIPDASCIRN